VDSIPLGEWSQNPQGIVALSEDFTEIGCPFRLVPVLCDSAVYLVELDSDVPVRTRMREARAKLAEGKSYDFYTMVSNERFKQFTSAPHPFLFHPEMTAKALKEWKVSNKQIQNIGTNAPNPDL
jgi:hypothetical protein